MTPSPGCIALIEEFEGFSPIPYKDAGGLCTIGFGHLIKPGELFDHVTEESAHALLQSDAEEAGNAVNELVTVPLSQNQFDALTSFTFNLGRAHLAGSTLLRLLNSGNYIAARQQFLRWAYIHGNECEGLKRRREAEAALFATPDNV